jgi:flagellar basal-body rod protein FlgF
VHGDDGVFRRAPVDGQPAPPMPADPSLRLLSGVLEGSNTNPMAAMVGMIANARRFEQQMQVIQQSDRNAERANGLLSISA